MDSAITTGPDAVPYPTPSEGDILARARDTGLDQLTADAAAQALTSVPVSINRAYRSPGAGIGITGTPASGNR